MHISDRLSTINKRCLSVTRVGLHAGMMEVQLLIARNCSHPLLRFLTQHASMFLT